MMGECFLTEDKSWMFPLGGIMEVVHVPVLTGSVRDSLEDYMYPNEI